MCFKGDGKIKVAMGSDPEGIGNIAVVGEILVITAYDLQYCKEIFSPQSMEHILICFKPNYKIYNFLLRSKISQVLVVNVKKKKNRRFNDILNNRFFIPPSYTI